MSNRVECPTVDEYTGATKALVKMALESGNGEMLRNLKVVMDFTKDCADRVNTVEAVLKAAYFCEAHEPIPAQPETCCPMCEAVHQDDLREKAEGEAERLREENRCWRERLVPYITVLRVYADLASSEVEKRNLHIIANLIFDISDPEKRKALAAKPKALSAAEREAEHD